MIGRCKIQLGWYIWLQVGEIPLHPSGVYLDQNDKENWRDESKKRNVDGRFDAKENCE